LEVAALETLCLEADLTPKQWIRALVRNRLFHQPEFCRVDRNRLRDAIEYLRALERHADRAGRSVSLRTLPPLLANARLAELTEIGRQVQRLRNALSEAIRGNLDYWRPSPSNGAMKPIKGGLSESRPLPPPLKS
jgi:hypothetical protein